MNQDYRNFLQDFWINRNHYKDDLYSICETNNIDLDQIFESQFCSLIAEKLFQELKNKIINNTTIYDRQFEHKLTDTFFHKRFGWGLISSLENDQKAYLGKISIPQKPKIQIGINTYLSG